jgi:hypothetical protein
MSQQTSVLSNHVPADNASEVGRMNFIIRSALSGLRTAIPVEVISVTNAGGVSPIGTVSVQPMVSAVDGSGQVWEHGTIYNVPYMRIQGGSNGIILDPVAGDIGIATVCDRDISTVKSAKKVSAPGSNRKNDMSDMVYLMTIIGAAPTQYVQFSSSGITITSPTNVTVNAPTAIVNSSTNVTMNTPILKVSGDIIDNYNTNTKTIASMRTTYNSHYHSDPQGGNTGAPSATM